MKNSLKPDSKALAGKKLRVKTTINSELIRARNVVGVLPGKDTPEIIVVGAHYDLNLDVNFRPAAKPGGRSDHSSFSKKDAPIIYLMAGFPPEYHHPGDHIKLVNRNKMVDIIKLGYLNIWDLANSEWGPAERK